ncbi:MAG TPA: hypothetical protein VGI22_11205 [Xanthobacteraceae bacterium]|jgi:hypothetical protein
MNLPQKSLRDDWIPIASAPFDQELELSVIEENEVHALLFPCRRTARGWVNASIKASVSVRPTHWRPWPPTRG